MILGFLDAVKTAKYGCTFVWPFQLTFSSIYLGDKKRAKKSFRFFAKTLVIFNDTLTSVTKTKFWYKEGSEGRLDSQVVFTLNFWTSVRYALGREFKPRWRQTLFRTQAQHLCFIHDSIWFVWFDTIICLSNLSCELWSRKLKKKIFLKKKKKNSLLYLKKGRGCWPLRLTFDRTIASTSSNLVVSKAFWNCFLLIVIKKQKR